MTLRDPAPEFGGITACLIVQDEEARLPDALRTIAFCDEVIVVDGGSTDRTVAIATAAGARVIENPWPGFAAQRNVALDAATTEWVIEVDADERVSPELATSIREFVDSAPDGIDIGACALRNRFLGAALGPSAKYPTYRFRVFRRERYRHDEQMPVHEGLAPVGHIAVLDGDLEHELADSWREALRDVVRYATLQAHHVAPPRAPRAYLFGIVGRPLAKLAYRAVLEGGWRDGWRGIVKITLDCASDALVWMLLLARRRRGDGHGNLGASDGHFGNTWWTLTGPVKIVAVASGKAATHRAAEWLSEVRAAGAEVALLTDQPGRELHGVRLRGVQRIGPINVLRAMEAEQQVQSADALVACGPQAKLAVRLLPRHLRGAVDEVGLRHTGAVAEQRVRSVARAT